MALQYPLLQPVRKVSHTATCLCAVYVLNRLNLGAGLNAHHLECYSCILSTCLLWSILCSHYYRPSPCLSLYTWQCIPAVMELELKLSTETEEKKILQSKLAEIQVTKGVGVGGCREGGRDLGFWCACMMIVCTDCRTLPGESKQICRQK